MGQHTTEPFLSIIIPMFNRHDLITRCLDSCLEQDFNDYELIVVDDYSADASILVVENYISQHPEKIIKLVKNPANLGLSNARGNGVVATSGRWIGFMDSDDTFRPGAFGVIHEKAMSVPDEVSEIRFCYWSDEHERVTPVPMMPEGIITFKEYLEWLEVVKNSDVFYCHRREVYESIQWPKDRQYSSIFYLWFASKYNIQMFPDVIGTMHNDAKNRNTAAKRGKGKIPPHIFKSAYDNAVGIIDILKELGPAMQRYSPSRYKKMNRSIAQNFFVAGRKWEGVRQSAAYLSRNFTDTVAWGILVLGLLSPKAVLRSRGYFNDLRKGY